MNAWRCFSYVKWFFVLLVSKVFSALFVFRLSKTAFEVEYIEKGNINSLSDART